MKIQDYQQIIKLTAKYPNSVDGFGIAYCYLGLLGEYAELLEEINKTTSTPESVIKEAGDVFWYITAQSNILNLNINKIFTKNLDILEEYNMIKVLSFCENIKKHYRDSKIIDLDLITNILTYMVSTVLDLLDNYNISNDTNITLDLVLETNYNKLINRRNNNTLNGDGNER